MLNSCELLFDITNKTLSYRGLMNSECLKHKPTTLNVNMTLFLKSENIKVQDPTPYPSPLLILSLNSMFIIQSINNINSIQKKPSKR